MEVVHHHIGSPRNITTAQKEPITSPLVIMLSTDSGGGCFCKDTTGLDCTVEEEDEEEAPSELFMSSLIILVLVAVASAR